MGYSQLLTDARSKLRHLAPPSCHSTLLCPVNARNSASPYTARTLCVYTHRMNTLGCASSAHPKRKNPTSTQRGPRTLTQRMPKSPSAARSRAEAIQKRIASVQIRVIAILSRSPHFPRLIILLRRCRATELGLVDDNEVGRCWLWHDRLLDVCTVAASAKGVGLGDPARGHDTHTRAALAHLSWRCSCSMPVVIGSPCLSAFLLFFSVKSAKMTASPQTPHEAFQESWPKRFSANLCATAPPGKAWQACLIAAAAALSSSGSP